MSWARLGRGRRRSISLSPTTCHPALTSYSEVTLYSQKRSATQPPHRGLLLLSRCSSLGWGVGEPQAGFGEPWSGPGDLSSATQPGHGRDSVVPGLLLPLCDTLTFLSGRGGGPAWSLIFGNAGNEMPHPPVGEYMNREVSFTSAHVDPRAFPPLPTSIFFSP